MISFNNIPSTLRVPGFYAEFDSSRANQGSSLKAYRGLLIGQKTTSGTATANVPVRITNAAQARTLFGAGSMLQHMAQAWFAQQSFTELWVIPMIDNASGVKASGKISITGPATKAGTLNVYLGGKKVEVAVDVADTAVEVAAALVAAIAADAELPCTAAVNGTSAFEVDLSFNHKGLIGNYMDIRLNYYFGEVTPTGLAVTITPMASGTSNPVLSAAVAAMGEEQYDVVANPYTDAANLTFVEDELASRWESPRMIEGLSVGFVSDTHANASTLGDSRNSPHSMIAGLYKCPTMVHEMAAAIAAVVAFYGAEDPARPFQTLALKGVLAPAEGDRFTLEERNLHLFDGISTLAIGADGRVRLERLITTYKTNAFGSPDAAYLDINIPLTLGYLRYDFRAQMSNTFPRHKLADDGARLGAGQAIVTPKTAKAKAIAIFAGWEERGLVENAEQFKNDLVVERNASDPNRLDFVLPPDLVNGLRVVAAKFQFRV